MLRPPRIIVHSLAHALAAAAAAAEAGGPVTLMSAPAAGGYMGPSWFRHVISAAAEAHPTASLDAVLDCGDAAGHALAAFLEGIPAVRVNGPPEALAALSDIATRLGGRVETGEMTDGPALDLRHAPDPAAACRDWLVRRGPEACT